MQGAYSTYFDNLFLALRLARTDFKAQAQYALRAGREARLGKAFEPLLNDLEAAINGFDTSLTNRNESTAGHTDTYRSARTAWLEFVDDTMKDYVTPKLRKLAVYADFRNFGKSRLTSLTQAELLTQSKALVALYAIHQEALFSTLAVEAKARLDAMITATATRDAQAAATEAAILGLADDRAAIARAQYRFKAQLELTFDNPAKVYSFFDFSKVKVNKSGKTKMVATLSKAESVRTPAQTATGQTEVLYANL